MLSTGSLRKPTPSRTPSSASKPAAPSPAPSSSPALSTSSAPPPDLASLLNLPLRLTLVATGDLPQRDVEGSLFAYESSFAVLATSKSNSKHSFQLIKTSQIKAVAVLSTSPDPFLPSPSAPLPPAPTSTAAELSSRVEKAVADDRKARARVGQGVSGEAQALFDALSKTMPCRWVGKSIVVLDEVMIDQPYTSGTVKGGKGAADRVERIKRVLEGIRGRMATPQPVEQE
ncbi:hypothetical protein JCM8547_006566 [Rhodosporidiobolus lusitaniae]